MRNDAGHFLPVVKLTDDELKLCNCASCRRTLLGESTVAILEIRSMAALPKGYRRVGAVRARIEGRPYCADCYECYLKVSEGRLVG